jgi:hypothetical protein
VRAPFQPIAWLGLAGMLAACGNALPELSSSGAPHAAPDRRPGPAHSAPPPVASQARPHPTSCPNLGTTELVARANLSDWLSSASGSEPKLRSLLEASFELAQLAGTTDASVRAACSAMANDLAVATSPAAATSPASAAEACRAAGFALVSAMRKAGGSFALEHERASCQVDMDALSRCAEACGAAPVCEGEVAGRCQGECQGRCSTPEGASCDGDCFGECDGTIVGRCAGACGGACKGGAPAAKDLGPPPLGWALFTSPASVHRLSGNAGEPCAGTCSGACQGSVAASCSGTCRGVCQPKGPRACLTGCIGRCTKSDGAEVPLDSPRCTGKISLEPLPKECRARCSALLVQGLQCTPKSTVRVTAARDPSLAGKIARTLETHLPFLLRAMALDDLTRALTAGPLGQEDDALPAPSGGIVADANAAIAAARATLSSAQAQGLEACLEPAFDRLARAAAGLRSSILAPLDVVLSVKWPAAVVLLPRASTRCGMSPPPPGCEPFREGYRSVWLELDASGPRVGPVRDETVLVSSDALWTVGAKEVSTRLRLCDQACTKASFQPKPLAIPLLRSLGGGRIVEPWKGLALSQKCPDEIYEQNVHLSIAAAVGPYVLFGGSEQQVGCNMPHPFYADLSRGIDLESGQQVSLEFPADDASLRAQAKDYLNTNYEGCVLDPAEEPTPASVDARYDAEGHLVGVYSYRKSAMYVCSGNYSRLASIAADLLPARLRPWAVLPPWIARFMAERHASIAFPIEAGRLAAARAEFSRE